MVLYTFEMVIFKLKVVFFSKLIPCFTFKKSVQLNIKTKTFPQLLVVDQFSVSLASDPLNLKPFLYEVSYIYGLQPG